MDATNTTPAPASAGTLRATAVLRARFEAALPIVLLIVAVAWQSLTALDCDVSWLLTVGERFLEGRRMYGEIMEVNPPASFLLYVPALAVARWTGVPAEFAAATSVFLLGIVMMLGAGRILAAAGMLPADRRPRLAAAAVFAFLVVPGQCFAQREHVAVLALLPLLAVLCVRSEARQVGRTAALLAGLAAGVTVAIKPYFAMAIVLPAARLVPWRSLWRVCGVELAATAAVVLVYGACVAAFFPDFLDKAVPLVASTYLPVREPLVVLIAAPTSLLLAALTLLCRWHARPRAPRSSPVAVCTLAALGFFAALLMQGKGYLNHAYPALALAVFAAAYRFATTPVPADLRTRRAVVGFAGLCASTCINFAHGGGYPGLAATVAKLAPPHPRMIAVASNLDVGHPLVRHLGGAWVGRRCSLWVTALAAVLRSRPGLDVGSRDALDAYYREDARILAEDVARGRPDVVLVDAATGRDWIIAHPDVARALARYRVAAIVGPIAVWLPTPAFAGRRTGEPVANEPKT